MLKIKRVTEPRETSDGARILVMRLWPRGVRRERVDEWNRDLAPSRELLFAVKHRGLPWREYVKRYWKEIRPETVDALRRRARHETITLLCICADETRCHRGLLRDAVARDNRSPGARLKNERRPVLTRRLSEIDERVTSCGPDRRRSSRGLRRRSWASPRSRSSRDPELPEGSGR